MWPGLGIRHCVAVLLLMLDPAAAQTVARTTPSRSADFRILTTTSLGPVRIGMTVQDAARALGSGLAPRQPFETEACWIASRVDGRDPGIFYMISNGRIRRIDIRSYNKNVPRVMSDRGVTIGSTEQDVHRAYGGRVQMKPHPYTAPDGHYLLISAPDERGGYIFETLHGKVTDFRAGVRPYLDYIEGCA